MLTRREWLNLTIGASAALTFDRSVSTRSSPSSCGPSPRPGEKIPVVGLGSSATFSQVARSEDVTALSEVLKALTDQGGTVFDTAPGYGASEEVAGEIAGELGITEQDLLGHQGERRAARGRRPPIRPPRSAQIDTSFTRSRRRKIDLIQVHNMGDRRRSSRSCKEFKKAGRGSATSASPPPTRSQYAELHRRRCATSRSTSSASTTPSTTATSRRRSCRWRSERKIGVLVYVPFGRTRLFTRVGNRPVPEWAKDFDADDMGAVLPQVRHRPSGGDLRHARHQPGQEHGRQHRRRPRPAPRRRHAQEDGAIHRGAAAALKRAAHPLRGNCTEDGIRSEASIIAVGVFGPPSAPRVHSTSLLRPLPHFLDEVPPRPP